MCLNILFYKCTHSFKYLLSTSYVLSLICVSAVIGLSVEGRNKLGNSHTNGILSSSGKCYGENTS